MSKREYVWWHPGDRRVNGFGVNAPHGAYVLKRCKRRVKIVIERGGKEIVKHARPEDISPATVRVW